MRIQLESRHRSPRQHKEVRLHGSATDPPSRHKSLCVGELTVDITQSESETRVVRQRKDEIVGMDRILRPDILGQKEEDTVTMHWALDAGAQPALG